MPRNRSPRSLLVAALLAALALPGAAAVAQPLATSSLDVRLSADARRLPAMASPSMVTIRAIPEERRERRGNITDILGQFIPELSRQSRRPVATGTGFVIDPDGHVVTNQSLLQGASAVEVWLADGRRLPAQLVRTD